MGLLAKRWWTLLVRGIVAVMFGIAAIVWPGITLVVLLTILGIYLLAAGVFSLVAAIDAARDQVRWWPLIIESLVEIGVGLALFSSPRVTTVTLLYFVAAWLVLGGIFRFIAAIELRREIEGEWLMILNGIVSFIFGLAVLANPGIGALAIVVVIGIYAIFSGITYISLSLTLRDWQVEQPEMLHKKAA